MAEYVESLDPRPLAISQYPIELPTCFTEFQLIQLVEGLASFRRELRTNGELNTWMTCKPFLHNLSEERRHGDPPKSHRLFFALFLFADLDRIHVKVEVVDLRTQKLAPSRSGMGHEREHGIEKRVVVGGLSFDAFEDFFYLFAGEV